MSIGVGGGHCGHGNAGDGSNKAARALKFLGAVVAHRGTQPAEMVPGAVCQDLPDDQVAIPGPAELAWVVFPEQRMQLCGEHEATLPARRLPGKLDGGFRRAGTPSASLRKPSAVSTKLPSPDRSFRRRIEASAAAPSRFHPTNEAFPRAPGGPGTGRETSTAKNGVVFGSPEASRARRKLRSGDGSFAPRRGSDPKRGETFDPNVTSRRPEKTRCRNTRALRVREPLSTRYR